MVDVAEFLQLELPDVCALWDQTTERQNRAAVQRIWLAYRGGELLATNPDFGPGKKSTKLIDFGIDANTSSRWQRIYRFGKAAIEKYISDAEEPTISGILQEIARQEEERHRVDREWSAEEREIQAQLEAGRTVVVNLSRHENLVDWADERGLYVRIDRQSEWGNPFKLERDGDRETVITNYRDYFLPHTGLVNHLDELKGKALGCWCAPEPCHGDVLAIEADGDS